MKSSRTYKLRLSDKGIALFLDQHARLAQLVSDFIPYGETLAVAIALLEAQAPCEIASELESAQCMEALGDNVRFVGCRLEVAELTRHICETVQRSSDTGRPPKVTSIYAAALSCMKSTDDREILAAQRGFKRTCIEVVLGRQIGK